ncbi:mitoferrin-1 [Neocloeon triangulifer]|uniref:mitoferrin-1 n=1 Tax=Neocloeon triangulifer TaxID=2078957 RepID=UPI00286EF244|nr:mitoferrin-1 [Neocloeon triangulifer]
MNPDDYEKLPTNNVVSNMSAGAIAGIMEHCVMYPLDSVKTRMQSLNNFGSPANRGIYDTLSQMVRQEGILRPCRGMSALVVGAGPAHALYFSCYEYSKDKLCRLVPSASDFAPGVAGALAALLHDGVMNPAEVVKQRLQMYGSPYKTSLECVRRVYRAEGMGAFYRSYTTQLTMNVPFQSIHFMTYELMQKYTNKTGNYNPKAHMVSGAMAGAIAAAATTPLDVCKTLLNTQESAVTGLVAAARTIYRLNGLGGFFKGLRARVLYQMPSTAICWSTYEFFKYCMNSNMRVEATALLPSIDVVSTTSPTKEDGAAPTPPLVRDLPPRIIPTHPAAQPVAPLSSLPALAFNAVHHSSHRDMHNTALLEGMTTKMPRS